MNFLRTILILTLLVSPAVAQDRNVALIIAMDVSGSITQDRYKLQLDGMASALVNRRFTAILSPQLPTSIMFMQWSAWQDIWVSEWFVLTSAEDAAALATVVREMPRRSTGGTGIAAALRRAREEFQRMSFTAHALVVDISGDGVENADTVANLRQARDALIEMSVTINGLPIGGDPAQNFDALVDFYRENVIGGPYHFLHPVLRDAEFARAFTRKFLLEIAMVED